MLCSVLLWVCRDRVPLKSQPTLLLTHRQGSRRSQEPYPKANISQNSFSGCFQLWCCASHLVATCRAHGQFQELRCEPSLTMSMFPLAGADRRNYIWGEKKVIVILWKSRESPWKDTTLSVNYWENNICGARSLHPPPEIGTKPRKSPPYIPQTSLSSAVTVLYSLGFSFWASYSS